MTPVEFFADHTYRMVFFGTSTIGLVAGALGTFAYLRKQALMSDVISHAALPGTLIAFLVAVWIGGDGRNMLGLIVGAVVVGTAAVLLAQWIASASKVRIDTAMAVTLTMFFGIGLILMRVITDGAFPGKGGIQEYLFGNASVITVADLTVSLTIGGCAIAIVLIFWKEFALRTFDPDHARVLGFSGRLIDTLMFMTIVLAIVIGVKAVGLVLMVAFIVTPPAAARQWTKTLGGMTALSAGFGALASGLGSYLSIVLGGVPTGPLIVLTLFAIFVVSLLCAPRRSIVMKIRARASARKAMIRDISGSETHRTGTGGAAAGVERS